MFPLQKKKVVVAGRSVFEDTEVSTAAAAAPSSSDEDVAAAAARLAESRRLEDEARRLGEVEGRWDAALDAWAAAAELTPERAGPHEGRARAALLVAQPRPRLALRAAGQAAYLDPASAQVRIKLALSQSDP
jgi:hypothetical protein